MGLTVTVPATVTRLTTLERVTEELGRGTPAAPVAATASYIVTTRVIASGSQPLAAQPDVPRNATITVVDANHSISAGTVTINGVDQLGATQAEVLNLASALTFTGTVLWASITSVVVAGLVGNGAADTLAVGIGSSVYLDAITSTSPTALETATINRMIDEASAAIAAYCHRVWGRETVTETLPGTGRRLLGLSRSPLVSVAAVLDDTAAITDYVIEDAAVGALARDMGWWPSSGSGWDSVAYSTGYIWPGYLRWRYSVTYTAGFILPEETGPNLPGGVERACLETVKGWFLARASSDPTIVKEEVGDVRVTYAQGATVGALPTVALNLLGPWRLEMAGM